jgi:hypothetical protein
MTSMHSEARDARREELQELQSQLEDHEQMHPIVR